MICPATPKDEDQLDLLAVLHRMAESAREVAQSALARDILQSLIDFSDTELHEQLTH